MTIILPTWFVFFLAIYFAFKLGNALLRSYQFMKMLKKAWPSIYKIIQAYV